MNDPFVTVEDSHPVLAIDFDWDEVARNERGEPIARSQEAANAASETVSLLVAICGEGVHKVKHVKGRAATVGIKFLCASLLMRPGQIKPGTVAQLAKTLGVTERRIWQVMASIRSNIARL